MDHIFSIRSPVGGPFGGFLVLAAGNSAAVNTGGGGYLSELRFSLDRCPGVGLLDHRFFFFFLRENWHNGGESRVSSQRGRTKLKRQTSKAINTIVSLQLQKKGTREAGERQQLQRAWLRVF